MSKMTPYHKRVDEQGKAWVAGDSQHNEVDDECTPDFSCCVPACFEPNRLVRLQSINAWRKRNGYRELVDA